MVPVCAELVTTNCVARYLKERTIVNTVDFRVVGLIALLGPFLAMPLGSGTLTSNDLQGPSEIHQGLGPYGPGCSYATGGIC